MSQEHNITKIRTDASRVDSEPGVGKMVDVGVDDNILLAQGHVPVLKRSFNLLGTLGLGFR